MLFLFYRSVLFILVILAIGCSGNIALPQIDSGAQGSQHGLSRQPGESILIKGPISPDGLRVILATGDLGVGSNRVSFVVTSQTGFVSEPKIRVISRFLATSGQPGDMVEDVNALFHQWPYGARGSYVTRLNFDKTGDWGIEILVDNGMPAPKTAHLFFRVNAHPSAVPVGSSAIASENKTLADVGHIAQLTTGSIQDSDLYQITIARAISSGIPTVLVISSPAFCSNEVCGPQVEVLQNLKEHHRGKAHFIHVDFYDNPDEIQGDLANARISPVVREWGLPSIEWTFVIDKKGMVVERFEGFSTFVELEATLLELF